MQQNLPTLKFYYSKTFYVISFLGKIYFLSNAYSPFVLIEKMFYSF